MNIVNTLSGVIMSLAVLSCLGILRAVWQHMQPSKVKLAVIVLCIVGAGAQAHWALYLLIDTPILTFPIYRVLFSLACIFLWLCLSGFFSGQGPPPTAGSGPRGRHIDDE